MGIAQEDTYEPNPPSPIKGRRHVHSDEDGIAGAEGLGSDGGTKGVELPPGMTVEEVKRRLSGKKPK